MTIFKCVIPQLFLGGLSGSQYLTCIISANGHKVMLIKSLAGLSCMGKTLPSQHASSPSFSKYHFLAHFFFYIFPNFLLIGYVGYF